MHILPYIGKAKMFLRAGSLFEKNCKETTEKSKQIFGKIKKNQDSQTHFGFHQHGVKSNMQLLCGIK